MDPLLRVGFVDSYSGEHPYNCQNGDPIITLPETDIASEHVGHPKRRCYLPTINFLVRTVSFREASFSVFFLPHVPEYCRSTHFADAEYSLGCVFWGVEESSRVASKRGKFWFPKNGLELLWYWKLLKKFFQGRKYFTNKGNLQFFQFSWCHFLGSFCLL